MKKINPKDSASNRTATQANASTRASIPSVMVPLSCLFLSPGNVRKTPTPVDALAAMIEAQGLLNPLQVTQAVSNRKQGPRYAVEAGGRRFRALNLLVSQGKLAEDGLIEVKVIDAGKATEVSLVENVSQEPMHPADEFEAYRALADQGQSLEVISHKFGVTVLHVQRRLKMAQVAPELLGVYRAGEATLDQIMALASVDDIERQLQVWNALPAHGRSAQALKRKLTEDELPATDERVAVIGMDSYLAAGGTVRADLFCDEGTRYLTDPGLVDRMLGELLAQEAATLQEKEGWAWVEVFEVYGYDQRQLHRRLPRSYQPELLQQEAERVSLEAKRDTLNAAHEAAQDGRAWGKAEQISGQITANETQIAALQDSRLDLTALDMTLAGAVVTVLNGSVTVYRGLAHSPHAKNQHGESDPYGRNGNGSDPRPRPEVPEKLMLNLSSHRTAAIQALMLGNPQVTLAALAHRMAITVLRPHDLEGHTIKLKLVQCRSTLEKNAPTLPNSRAVQALNRQREDWLARLPAESAEWFDWLLVQTQDTVLALIVFASAQSAEAVQVSAQGDDASAPLARALSLDMADWWEATPENYLGLVPKAKLMEAVTETAGEQVAASMLKMKKDGAIAHASQHVLGRRWLPAPLRSIPVASASAVESSQVDHAVKGEV